jgi:hypothetical protein
MRGANKADADATSAERNDPDPTIVSHEDSNASRTLKFVRIVAGKGAGVVIDGAPSEAFDEFQSATGSSHDAAATRGVNQVPGACRANRPVGMLRLNCNVVLRCGDPYCRFFQADAHPRRPRSVHENCVKTRAVDLVSGKRCSGKPLSERILLASVVAFIVKFRAGLLLKAFGVQVDADSLKSQVRDGKERLSDLKPGEPLRFEQHRLETCLGHERSEHASRGPPANDGNVHSLLTIHELRR